MERCKFCGEVINYESQFCHACGKSTAKKPSKSFLRKKAKRDAFVVNYDAKLKRTSYIIFGVLFLIASLALFALYGQGFFGSLDSWLVFFEKEPLGTGTKFVDAINKVFEINTKVNEYVPLSVSAAGASEVTIFLAIYGIAFVLSVASLFTKRTSISAIMYKVATIIGLLYLIFVELLSSFLFELLFDKVYEYFDIISYAVGGVTLLLFLVGFVTSFNLKNPYRATWYQGFKALYFCAMVWLTAVTYLLVDVIKLDNLKVFEILTLVSQSLVYNFPIYIFIASILLFIGCKYRGDLERLK